MKNNISIVNNWLLIEEGQYNNLPIINLDDVQGISYYDSSDTHPEPYIYFYMVGRELLWKCKDISSARDIYKTIMEELKKIKQTKNNKGSRKIR